jgi:HAD superfamily hydrolase (TIGR01509 family)
LKYSAVFFDCDGVLVDSEHISSFVLREMLQELGLTMTQLEVELHFNGKTMKDELSWISSQVGKSLPKDWLYEFWHRRNSMLSIHLQPIPNAKKAVQIIHAKYSGQIACTSGGDRTKIELQLIKVGLLHFFTDRIFSGYEVALSKPAPDIYLKAASVLGVNPEMCAVIEDSVTGVLAGVAAGATVFGYVNPDNKFSQTSAYELIHAGAKSLFTDMNELSDLL